MRFVEHGPNIPDDLLFARDEGRVIFICGAGVSLAKARLPDFHGLTKKVVSDLKVQSDSRAYQLLNLPQKVEDMTGGGIPKDEISPFISADRVFGELEKDFDKIDIERSVASCLRPAIDVDLSAHKLILDLAKGPDGKIKLVTTNFDRLFENCHPKIKCWTHPNLPTLNEQDPLDGIVYLHGHTNKNYDGSGKGGFVLSSSEFGQAYLADGWATSFIKDIIDTHVIVFLGYSADDPPVRYLLEALGRYNSGTQSIYAFQSGTQSYAEGLWSPKGVSAISYNPENRHSALWESLECWASRAKNPDKWFKSLVGLATRGPRELKPYQRGQIAHLISSKDHSKLFVNAKKRPPGEWLYVFDPKRRYAMPSRPYFQENEVYQDPFLLYSLDNDPTPERFDPDELNRKQREVPENAWSAFDLTPEDKNSIENINIATYSYTRNGGVANLPPRLSNIGDWLAKSAEDPATLAWCVSQLPLQDEIVWKIERHVDELTSKRGAKKLVEQWQYLLHFWKSAGVNPADDMDWYHIKRLAPKTAWSPQFIRRYGQASRPYLTVKKGYGQTNIAPKSDYNRALVHIDVEYPNINENIETPKKSLAKTVEQLRISVFQGGLFEDEVGTGFTFSLVPITRGSDHNVNTYARTDGLSGLMLEYVSEFKKLAAYNIRLAQNEIASWPAEHLGVFTRLRIWVAKKDALVPENQLITIFNGISNEAFWHSGNQRDLLTTLEARWNSLSGVTKKYFEKRLLKGPNKAKWDKTKEEHTERRAWSVLNTLAWLTSHNCNFSFDLEKTLEKLKPLAPKWEPKFGERAADERGTTGGFVHTNKEHDSLIGLSFNDIFTEAQKQKGRDGDWLVENDPFLGFVETHPVRALAALSYVSKKKDPPIWAWRAFFNHDQRKTDTPLFSRLILSKLMTLDKEVLTSFVYQVTWWLRDHASILTHITPTDYDFFFDTLLNIIVNDEALGDTKIINSGKTREWASEALNSSIGHLVDAHFFDNRVSEVTKSTGLPKYWLKRVSEFLTSTGGLAPLAIAEISARIQWIHYYEPAFSLRLVKTILTSNNNDIGDAFWGGFFLRARIPNADLFELLKPYLMSLVENQTTTIRGYRDPLAGLILGGWRTSKNQNRPPFLINDEELTTLILKGRNEFRTSLLYHAQTWSISNLNDTEENNKFPKLLTPLFKYIWPQQLSVRTPAVSNQLYGLLISNEAILTQLYDIVLPLLVPIEEQRISFVHFHKKDVLIDKHPLKVLNIFNAILPRDARNWPYGISGIFNRLEKAHPAITSNLIFIRLKAKFEKR